MSFYNRKRRKVKLSGVNPLNYDKDLKVDFYEELKDDVEELINDALNEGDDLVYYAKRNERIFVGHGDYLNVKIILSPIFKRREDCEAYIMANEYHCYGAKIESTTIIGE